MSRELPEFPNLDHLKEAGKGPPSRAAAALPPEPNSLRPSNIGCPRVRVCQLGGAEGPRRLTATLLSRFPADATLRAFDGAASHTGPQFGRYNAKARQALFFSRYEAALHGSPRIEPEHVLLGLIHRHNEAARREGKDLPGRIFERSQLSVETVRNEVEASLQGSPVVRSREESAIGALEAHGVPFSSDTKALFMTVWCPDSRSVESNCGIPRAEVRQTGAEERPEVSVDRQRAARTRALSFAKQSSMGLRSGL